MSALPDTAPAGEPEPRFFGEATSLPCHDWESPESRRIVATGKQGIIIEFVPEWYTDIFGGGGRYLLRDADEQVILDLRGTRWVWARVIHVTESGAEQVRGVFWLLPEDGSDSRVNGVTSRTGPDGDVWVLEELPVSSRFQSAKSAARRSI